MSQFPPQPPGQPPAPYGAMPPSPHDLLVPARRAGTMMIVLGAVAVICGLFSAYKANTFDTFDMRTMPEIQRKMEQQIQELEQQTGMSIRTIMLIGAAIPLVAGAVLGGLGFVVRGGGLLPVILSIVLVSLGALFLGLLLLGGLVQGAMMGGPMMVVSACMYGVPLALMVLLLVWLFQAARAATHVRASRQYLEAQTLYYQQQQLAFRQPPGSPPPPGVQPPTLPPPYAGGYHQYPGATAPPPPGPTSPGLDAPAPTQPPASPGPADRGDSTDGPPPER